MVCINIGRVAEAFGISRAALLSVHDRHSPKSRDQQVRLQLLVLSTASKAVHRFAANLQSAVTFQCSARKRSGCRCRRRVRIRKGKHHPRRLPVRCIPYTREMGGCKYMKGITSEKVQELLSTASKNGATTPYVSYGRGRYQRGTLRK